MAGVTNKSPMFTTFMDSTHKTLLEASKTPIAGVAPSALQAVIGTVQFTASAVLGLSAGAVYLATKNQSANFIATNSVVHGIIGLLSTANAAANIFSLTYFNNHPIPNRPFFNLV